MYIKITVIIHQLCTKATTLTHSTKFNGILQVVVGVINTASNVSGFVFFSLLTGLFYVLTALKNIT